MSTTGIILVTHNAAHFMLIGEAYSYLHCTVGETPTEKPIGLIDV